MLFDFFFKKKKTKTLNGLFALFSFALKIFIRTFSGKKKKQRAPIIVFPAERLIGLIEADLNAWQNTVRSGGMKRPLKNMNTGL